MSEEDSTLVEYLDIRLIPQKQEMAPISVLTYASDRGHNDSVYVDNYAPQIMLLDRTYQDVYYNVYDSALVAKNPDLAIIELYYSKGQGVVGFKMRDGNYWVLEALKES